MAEDSTRGFALERFVFEHLDDIFVHGASLPDNYRVPRVTTRVLAYFMARVMQKARAHDVSVVVGGVRHYDTIYRIISLVLLCLNQCGTDYRTSRCWRVLNLGTKSDTALPSQLHARHAFEDAVVELCVSELRGLAAEAHLPRVQAAWAQLQRESAPRVAKTAAGVVKARSLTVEELEELLRRKRAALEQQAQEDEDEDDGADQQPASEAPHDEGGSRPAVAAPGPPPSAPGEDATAGASAGVAGTAALPMLPSPATGHPSAELLTPAPPAEDRAGSHDGVGGQRAAVAGSSTDQLPQGMLPHGTKGGDHAVAGSDTKTVAAHSAHATEPGGMGGAMEARAADAAEEAFGDQGGPDEGQEAEEEDEDDVVYATYAGPPPEKRARTIGAAYVS